jgi:hypothetical protein
MLSALWILSWTWASTTPLQMVAPMAAVMIRVLSLLSKLSGTGR